MVRKALTTAMLVVVSAGSVMAATQYYVAKDITTNKCAVVDKKPDGKTMMDVGTKPYATKVNAEDAMAKLKDCK